MQKLCQEQMITGFPSIRVYRKGTDDIVVHGFHEHEAYRGDRTQTALTAFVDKVVPSAGQPTARSSDTRRMTLGQGCMVCNSSSSSQVPVVHRKCYMLQSPAAR